MFNAFALFRSLVIYGTCLPLAIFLGYLVTNPEDVTSEAIVGLVLAVLMVPLMLRLHHPLLVLSWNASAFAFFLPGKPSFFLLLSVVSFTISIFQFAVDRKNRFIPTPTVTLPLLTLGAVVVVTARLTGGIGLRVAGGDSYGGKHYIFLFSGILGYFALIARRIPLERAGAYLKMYFLGGLTAGIGALVNFVAPSLYFIFLIFPADTMMLQGASAGLGGPGSEIVRMSSVGGVGLTMAVALLAVYGVREIMNLRRLWLPVLFLACTVGSLMGGFRASILTLLVLFGLMFWLEGLVRTRLTFALVLAFILTSALVLPFTDHLPLSVQRSLSFLPVNVSPVAAADAQGSIDWRVGMWERALTEVPSHLLLGKGYAINAGDLEMFAAKMLRGADPFEVAFLAGDYHSGPLSVILPFGIWGVIAFLWFLYAGGKVIYQNYLLGNPRIRKANTALLAYYLTKVIFFFFVFGSLFSDLAVFTGLIGMSVALNGGVLSSANEPVVESAPKPLRLITLAR